MGRITIAQQSSAMSELRFSKEISTANSALPDPRTTTQLPHLLFPHFGGETYKYEEKNSFLHIIDDTYESLRATRSMPVSCSRNRRSTISVSIVPSETVETVEGAPGSLNMVSNKTVALEYIDPTIAAASAPTTSSTYWKENEKWCDVVEEAILPASEGKKWKRGPKRDNAGKCLCTFFVGIQKQNGFQIAQQIIGSKGKNMKYISQLCPGTKIRVRGRGSGFREGENNVEADIPLQIHLSSPNRYEYDIARKEVARLLEGIYREYYQMFGKETKLRYTEHVNNPKN